MHCTLITDISIISLTSIAESEKPNTTIKKQLDQNNKTKWPAKKYNIWTKA